MSRIPGISVIIPARNAARYLVAAVRSTLQQTCGDFECIVVDDGSADDTPTLLRWLARDDARVRPARAEGSGIVAALNTGLRLARAPIVARMDADDVNLPHRFQRQLAYLLKHPDCVAVGSRVLFVDPYGSPLWESSQALTHDQIEERLLAGDGWAMFHPTVMLRRKPLLEVGGYRKEFQWAEDIDLFLRLARVGRLANLPDVLLHYRQHLHSVNKIRRTEQANIIREVVAEAGRVRGREIASGGNAGSADGLPPFEQIRVWTGMALKTGKVGVARRHAVRALCGAPLKLDAWKVLLYAARGRVWKSPRRAEDDSVAAQSVRRASHPCY